MLTEKTALLKNIKFKNVLFLLYDHGLEKSDKITCEQYDEANDVP